MKIVVLFLGSFDGCQIVFGIVGGGGGEVEPLVFEVSMFPLSS